MLYEHVTYGFLWNLFSLIMWCTIHMWCVQLSADIVADWWWSAQYKGSNRFGAEECWQHKVCHSISSPWLAPVGLHSTGCTQQPSEWLILSHIDCSVSVRLWHLRSSGTVIIRVLWGHPGGLFQYSGGVLVTSFFASIVVLSCGVPKQRKMLCISWQSEERLLVYPQHFIIITRAILNPVKFKVVPRRVNWYMLPQVLSVTFAWIGQWRVPPVLRLWRDASWYRHVS